MPLNSHTLLEIMKISVSLVMAVRIQAVTTKESAWPPSSTMVPVQQRAANEATALHYMMVLGKQALFAPDFPRTKWRSMAQKTTTFKPGLLEMSVLGALHPAAWKYLMEKKGERRDRVVGTKNQ